MGENWAVTADQSSATTNRTPTQASPTTAHGSAAPTEADANSRGGLVRRGCHSARPHQPTPAK